jgi:hypothetical protein
LSINVDRWKFNQKPHIVTDQGFGQFDLINEVQQWGGMMTSAMPAGSSPFLWDVLFYNANPNTFRVANLNEMIVSGHTIIETKNHAIIHQRIASTAFVGTSINLQLSSISNENTLLISGKYYIIIILNRYAILFTRDIK